MAARKESPTPPARPSRADLSREIERLRRALDDAERARTRLERENDRLKTELEAARRAGKRQAAPFSKGPPTTTPRRPGRPEGRRHGRHAHRRAPAQVDDVIDVPLPAACPDCGGGLEATRVATQVQEDLPVVRPRVRQFDIHVGHCRQCGRRVQGRHPLQTTDALGAASAHVGPQAVALMVVLNKYLGLSHAKIATLLRDWFTLTLRPSAVTHALHRAARQAAPTYAALRDTIRGSPVVSPDETSWKVGGQLHWLWAFATPTTVLYTIARGRGFADAEAVLGADYAGVLVRDGWAPYRQFTDARHQTCFAHLLRRAKDLATTHPRATWPRQVSALLQDALALRDRHTAGTVSDHGLAVARGHLVTRLATCLGAPVRHADLQRFAAHLTVELPAMFGFLFDPTVDATNWRAEHAIRPAVVNRKVSGGNRSPRGADAQQILASLVHTARLRHLDTREILVDLLQAPTPTVSPVLASPN